MTAPVTVHRCPIRGCKVRLPARLLMCGQHWYMVPTALRDRVYAAYRGGRGIGTWELADAQEEAIAAVHDRIAEAGR